VGKYKNKEKCLITVSTVDYWLGRDKAEH